jgi:hypothetical protein
MDPVRQRCHRGFVDIPAAGPPSTKNGASFSPLRSIVLLDPPIVPQIPALSITQKTIYHCPPEARQRTLSRRYHTNIIQPKPIEATPVRATPCVTHPSPGCTFRPLPLPATASLIRSISSIPNLICGSSASSSARLRDCAWARSELRVVDVEAGGRGAELVPGTPAPEAPRPSPETEEEEVKKGLEVDMAGRERVG